MLHKSNIPGVKVVTLEFFSDERGSVSEMYRMDSDFLYGMKKPEMGYVGYTNPGVSRGPHEHYTQSDCFVFLGPAEFEVHLWDRRGSNFGTLTIEESLATHEKFVLGGDTPSVLIIPPFVVHGYRNISSCIGMSLNFPNELYAGWKKKEIVDEVRWEKMPNNPFHIE